MGSACIVQAGHTDRRQVDTKRNAAVVLTSERPRRRGGLSTAPCASQTGACEEQSPNASCPPPRTARPPLQEPSRIVDPDTICRCPCPNRTGMRHRSDLAQAGLLRCGRCSACPGGGRGRWPDRCSRVRDRRAGLRTGPLRLPAANSRRLLDHRLRQVGCSGRRATHRPAAHLRRHP